MHWYDTTDWTFVHGRGDDCLRTTVPMVCWRDMNDETDRPLFTGMVSVHCPVPLIRKSRPKAAVLQQIGWCIDHQARIQEAALGELFANLREYWNNCPEEKGDAPALADARQLREYARLESLWIKPFAKDGKPCLMARLAVAWEEGAWDVFLWGATVLPMPADVEESEHFDWDEALAVAAEEPNTAPLGEAAQLEAEVAVLSESMESADRTELRASLERIAKTPQAGAAGCRALCMNCAEWPGRDSQDFLVTCAKTAPDPLVRAFALEALVRKPGNRADLFLERSEAEDNGIVRGVAFQCLVKAVKGPESAPLLRDRALNDPNQHARAACMAALAKCDPKESHPFLIERSVEDNSGIARGAALQALASIRPIVKVRGHLKSRYRKDKDTWVRIAALEALATHWPDEETEKFLEAVCDMQGKSYCDDDRVDLRAYELINELRSQTCEKESLGERIQDVVEAGLMYAFALLVIFPFILLVEAWKGIRNLLRKQAASGDSD